MNTRMIIAATLVMLTGMACSAPVSAEEIEWQPNYQAALEAAQPDGKIIMVDVFTDWCGWCDKLDSDVYTDAAVVEFSRKIVNLKIDAEDGGEGQSLAEKFGVSGFPTILFLTADGREVDRIGGFLPAPQFLEEMKRIERGEGTFLSLQEAHAAGTISGEMLLELAQSYAMRNMVTEAEAPLQQYLESRSGEQDSNTDRANGMLAQVKLGQGDFESGERILMDLYNNRPDSEFMPSVLLTLTYLRAMQSDKEGAQAFLDELKRRFPGEVRAVQTGEQILSQM